METMELHRGRLIDHLQLVVRDLPASRRFYQAVFDTIGIPVAGEGPDYFCLLYTSPSPRDVEESRMPSSA